MSEPFQDLPEPVWDASQLAAASDEKGAPPELVDEKGAPADTPADEKGAPADTPADETGAPVPLPRVNPRVEGNHAYVLPYNPRYRHRFDILENQYPPSPKIAAAMARVVAEGEFHLYPDPDPAHYRLRRQIAEYVGCRKPNVLLTAASDSALKLICDTFLCPESVVLVPVPTYPHFLSFLDAAPHAALARLEWSGGAAALVAELEAFHPDICYLCNPGMPIGYAIAHSDIEGWATQYPKTLFVIDEAYFEYGTGHTAADLAQSRENVIVTRTFSKAFGLAALRIGFLVASERNLGMLRVVHNAKSVTKIAQAAASAALDDLPWYRRQIAELVNVRQALSAQAFGRSEFVYGSSVRFGPFFSLLCRDTAYLTRVFKANGMLVRDKHADVPNSVRLAIGRPAQMTEVMRLARTVNDFKSGALLSDCDVFLDLDDTLRGGAHRQSEYYPLAAPFVRRLRRAGCDVYITTNNSCQTPDEIQLGLEAAGIHIAREHIRTPLTVARALFAGRKDLHVVGSQNVRDYFADMTGERPKVVLIANDFHRTLDGGLSDLCDLLRTCELYAVEDPVACSLRTCGDTARFTDNAITRVPDLGGFLAMLKASLGVEPREILGKPNTFMVKGSFQSHCRAVVIGDGMTDAKLAERLDCPFIGVGGLADIYPCPTPFIPSSLEELVALPTP